MNLDRLEMRIRRDEGFSQDPYQDTVGVWTIGYGTTLLNGKAVTADTPRITQREGLDALQAGVFRAMKHMQDIFRADRMNEVRQEVLVNMAYNLGKAGLFGFFKLRMAISARDWHQASLEIEDSKYFEQVGNRGIRLRDAFESGEWGSSA